MESKIVYKNGFANVMINGKLYPFAGYRSFHPKGEFVKSFSENGFKFFNIFPSGIMTALKNRTVPYSNFGPVWVGEEEYNWDNLKAQTDLFLKNSKDGYFILMIHLDAPDWLIEKYPGDVYDTWGEFINGACSDTWRAAAVKYMYALMDKLDEIMPERVFGYFLMCGGTTEWYTHDLKNATDNPSESQLRAYRAFVGDEAAVIPGYKAYCDADNGILTTASDVVEYKKFLSYIEAKTLMYFAEKAKEHTRGKRVVGAMYGYTGLDCSDMTKDGYLCADMVYNDENIDVIACPASYNFRKLDSTGAFRTATDSLTLHKMLYIHEIDCQTFLTYKNNIERVHMDKIDDVFHNISENSAYLRREVSMLLAKRQGFWIFDMTGGWYEDDELRAELSSLKRLQQAVSEKQSYSISEAAVFIDLESNAYVPGHKNYPMNEFQIREMNLAGFPWDMYITSDLLDESFDFNRYKLYIFPNLFYADERIVGEINRLRSMGKCILFMHMPGYVSKNMTDVTGLRLKKCDFKGALSQLENSDETIDFTYEIVPWKAQMGEKCTCNEFPPIFYIDEECEAVSRYVKNDRPSIGIKYRENGGFDAYSAIAPLYGEMISNIAARAGVFSYINPGNVIYANNRIVCIYSKNGGYVNLKWKEKVILKEFFSNEEYETDSDGTDILFGKHETKVFLVSEDVK